MKPKDLALCTYGDIPFLFRIPFAVFWQRQRLGPLARFHMSNVVTTILAAFAWVVAPAGLVVSTLLLWQNVQKLREAHLRIRELEYDARARERRVQPATLEEQLQTQAEFDRLMLNQRNLLRTKAKRAVATSLCLMLLAGIPLLVVLDHMGDQSAQFAGVAAANDRLATRIHDDEEVLRRTREAVSRLEQALRNFVRMHEDPFITPEEEAQRKAIEHDLDAARAELGRAEHR